MATIVIKLDPKANQLRLIEAIELLKGVKSITVASDEEISDQFIASQMAISRKSGKGDKDKVMEFLGN
jgi:cell division protein FtsX